MKYLGRIKVTGKRQITLPAEMCRDLGIEQGNILEIECVGGELRLRPQRTSRPFASDDPIFGLIGAFETPEVTDSGKDHDQWIADEAGKDNLEIHTR